MVSEKIEYLNGIATRLIAHVPIFKGLVQGELTNFLCHSQQFVLAQGTEIFREGDPSRLTYVVLRGSVEVSQLADLTSPVGVFGPGECFGEMALADSLPRSATAVAKENCVLLAFSEELLCRAERLERTVFKNLATLLMSRCNRLDRQLASFLGTHCHDQDCVGKVSAATTTPPPNGMDGQSLTWMSVVGRVQTLKAGQPVIWEGATGQALYVVMEGELEVTRAGQAAQQRVARLTRGECFGEVGFLDDSLPRTAGVRAAIDAKVLRLEGRDIQRVPKLATTVYRYLARKLSMRVRGLNRAYAQIAVGNCREECVHYQTETADAQPTAPVSWNLGTPQPAAAALAN